MLRGTHFLELFGNSSAYNRKTEKSVSLSHMSSLSTDHWSSNRSTNSLLDKWTWTLTQIDDYANLALHPPSGFLRGRLACMFPLFVVSLSGQPRSPTQSVRPFATFHQVWAIFFASLSKRLSLFVWRPRLRRPPRLRPPRQQSAARNCKLERRG